MKTAGDADFYSYDPYAYNDKPDSGLMGRTAPDGTDKNGFIDKPVQQAADIFAKLGQRAQQKQPNHTSINSIYTEYRKGNKNAAYPLLKALDPTIESALRSFVQGDKAYKTKARVLALEAVNSYDPTKGASLSTHVFNNLQRLQRIGAQRSSIIRMPENAALQRRAVERARQNLELENGEEPTVEEIADEVGLDIKRVNKLLSTPATASESQFTGESGDLLSSKQDRALDLYDRFIYEELDRNDKKIYEWSTGYGGAKKLSRGEMARKLGISEAAVSMRASKIAQKFNEDREMIRRAFMGGDEQYGE